MCLKDQIINMNMITIYDVLGLTVLSIIVCITLVIMDLSHRRFVEIRIL